MTFWEQTRSRVAAVMVIVNQKDGVRTVFKETTGPVDLNIVPTSRFDGVYSVEFRGYPTADFSVNAQNSYDVTARLNCGFMMNQRRQPHPITGLVDNSKPDYNRAVDDILSVVKEMAITPEFTQVVFLGTSPLEKQAESENFLICTIDFTLTVTVTQ